METLKDILRRERGKEKAPDDLRRRIFQGVAQEASRLRRRRRMVGTGLAAALLLLGLFAGGRELYVRHSVDRLVEDLADDHLESMGRPMAAEDPNQVNTDDPEKLADALRDKVGFAFQVPEIEGSRLVGGRFCLLRNLKIALLFYKLDHRLLSLFVTEGEKIPLAEKELLKTRNKGLTVILWKKDRFLYSLVSDLPGETLLPLAARLN